MQYRDWTWSRSGSTVASWPCCERLRCLRDSALRHEGLWLEGKPASLCAPEKQGFHAHVPCEFIVHQFKVPSCRCLRCNALMSKGQRREQDAVCSDVEGGYSASVWRPGCWGWAFSFSVKTWLLGVGIQQCEDLAVAGGIQLQCEPARSRAVPWSFPGRAERRAPW